MPWTNNRPQRIGPLAALLALLGLAAISSPQGQRQVPPRDQRIPRYDASAVVKLIVVRVLDESGRAVRGLRKEDFTLTDNGEAKTITEFESHAMTESGTTVVPAEPGAQAATRTSQINRKIFLFLDLQGNDEVGNANAKTAALEFVETQLRPGDEVGVLGFSPMRGFFIQVYLTSDIEMIRMAIKGAKELPPSGGEFVRVGPDDQAGARGRQRGGGGTGATDGAMMSQERNLGRAPDSGGSFDEISSIVFVPGTGIFARMDFNERMSDLAQAMKFVPGNKSLVLFSGRSVGPAAALGKTFADAGTPVYAVNTRNWIMRGVFTMVKESYLWKEHPLKDLSLASGGEYFADIKDVQAISRGVQELTANYYVLGYYVKENWDGAYHRIKVDLKRPGLRVLAQDGYFNPKPYADMSPFEKELQTFDLLYSQKPASAPGPELPMTVLDVSPPGGRERLMLVELAVDPKNGVRPAEVEIFALVRDETLTPVVSLAWQVDLARYNGKTVVLCTRSPTEPGTYSGRIAVRDPATGWAAVGQIRFTADVPAGGDIVLSTPLLLAPGAEAKIGLMPSPTGGRGAAREQPFLEIYPFIPRGHRIIIGSLDRGASEIMAVVPVKIRALKTGGPPRIEIGGRLLPSSGGEEIPLDVEIIEVKKSADGREFLVVKIRLPEVPPGTYDLEISANDADSGANDSVRTALVLK